MLPYVEMHAESIVLLVGFGLLGFLALVLVHQAADLSVGGREGEPTEFPDGLREGHGPVPVLLVALYAGLAIWAIVYVLAHAFGVLEFGG